MTEELKEKLVGVADNLIDQMVEENGVYWTIEWLMDVGKLTGRELMSIGFDPYDIQFVLDDRPYLDPTWKGSSDNSEKS